MTTLRRFCCNDLLRFASVNLDHLTGTFSMSFYMTHLARWPDYFRVAEAPGSRIMGYTSAWGVRRLPGRTRTGPSNEVYKFLNLSRAWFPEVLDGWMIISTLQTLAYSGIILAFTGKLVGQGESLHVHLIAITLAPEYRRQQLGKRLMNLLEDIGDKIDKAYFMNLIVRASSSLAIKMYEKLGYVVHRRLSQYYSQQDDGLDMRKALPRDVDKKSMIPLKWPGTPDELEHY